MMGVSPWEDETNKRLNNEARKIKDQKHQAWLDAIAAKRNKEWKKLKAVKTQ